MKKKLPQYIVFLGAVGTGKTTQSKKLVEKLQDKYSDKKVVWTREPGGAKSEIATAIRNLVQATEFGEEMDPVCEAYLYAAARAQSLRQEVFEVVKNGGIVVSDSSVHTSVANQGVGRGLTPELVWKINKVALGNLKPDKVIVVDVPLDTSLSRLSDHKGDKFEKLGAEYHQRVRQAYLDMAKDEPEVFCVVDGVGSVDEVHSRILNCLEMNDE